ncbi:carbohydrate-binding module family 1 protein [Xylariaceae sp. FL0804]|nr:carbohydrate-binding module family 1 protein [Xylariaceae sp. FL0804]
MRHVFLLLAAVAAPRGASAHTIFVQLEAGGETYPVSYAIRDPSYDGPITNVSSTDLACNGGPNPTTPSSDIINVTAGATVQAVWRHTLTSGADDVMDSSHLGPTLAYMKKVSDAVTDVGYGDGWFKINEVGYSDGVWGTSEVIDNEGLQPFQIPDCLEDGQYLLRAEMIALHAATSEYGAQFYMECAQINVSGGSATVSPATYSIPGIYAQDDPGILINIYTMTDSSTYTIPGPAPFACAGGSGSSSTATSTPSAVTTTTPVATTATSATSTKTTATSATSTKTTASTATASATSSCAVAQWGQCGGSSFAGCTACSSPYTCEKQNDYYSQCT